MGRKGALLLTSFGLALGMASLASAAEAPRKYTETIKNKEGKEISFDVVLVPGGKFTMGSPESEKGHKPHEGPQFAAEVKPFYLAATETTFQLFMAYYDETVQEKRGDAAEAKKKEDEAKKKGVDAISGPTPLYGDPTLGWGAGRRPAIGVTWHNAETFCKWLSKKTGKPYRLPTEAEWEYACRGGSKAAYSFGDDPAKLEDFGWFEDNSDEKTQEVAQKKPNAFGLYDMHGNVREWVTDLYGGDTYADNAKKNPVSSPTGPKESKVKTADGFAHVARGGAYNSSAAELRSAARTFEEPFWRFEDPQEPKSKWWLPKMGFIGFRVACDATEK
jgi:formylglycine-generating enzyme required for sulfatase activity